MRDTVKRQRGIGGELTMRYDATPKIKDAFAHVVMESSEYSPNRCVFRNE